jgi:hypothetical protein
MVLVDSIGAVYAQASPRFKGHRMDLALRDAAHLAELDGLWPRIASPTGCLGSPSGGS